MPILNPAPPWQPDRSDYVILWHGCTALDKNAIEKNGIDLSYCRVDTDFGRGFYTKTLEHQARHWAWERFFDRQAKNPGGTANQPIVLRFRMARHGSHGLDGLASLSFVRGTYDDEDYWSLVQHCRQSTLVAINDHCRPPNGWYELVSGPVAAFWEQRVAMKDGDQFSFHADGIRLLNRLITQGKGKGALANGDADSYQWLPVP